LPPPCVLRTRGSVKDVPEHSVKDVMRLNKERKDGAPGVMINSISTTSEASQEGRVL
jgi:hypothetical protein